MDQRGWAGRSTVRCDAIAIVRSHDRSLSSELRIFIAKYFADQSPRYGFFDPDSRFRAGERRGAAATALRLVADGSHTKHVSQRRCRRLVTVWLQREHAKRG